MLSEQAIREDDNSNISGYIEIIDMAKLSLSFLAQLDFTLIKRMGVFAEKAQPTRLKGVHLINCPKEGVALLNLAKSLMPSKLQQRVSGEKKPRIAPRIVGATSANLFSPLIGHFTGIIRQSGWGMIRALKSSVALLLCHSLTPELY